MRGAIPQLPQYVFTTWCLIKQEVRLHDVECIQFYVALNVTTLPSDGDFGLVSEF